MVLIPEAVPPEFTGGAFTTELAELGSIEAYLALV